MPLLFVQLENCHKGFGGQLHSTQGTHFLLAFLLLLQQLLLSGDVAAVALGQHVLSHGLDGLPGDDLAADGCLDRDLKQLAGNVLLQLFADLPGPAVRLFPVNDEAQGVYLVPVEEQVHLHQVAPFIALQLVVQAGVSLGPGLQGVEEVVDDLADGHGVVQLHQIGVQILHILKNAPAVLTHGHDVAHIVRGRDDGHLGVGLPRLADGAGIGVVVGIIHPDHSTICFGDLINNGG